MAKYENRRLSTHVLAADRQTLIGVLSLPGYLPANSEYSSARLAELARAAEEAQQAELKAANTLTLARNAAVAAEWALHNALLGAKAGVVAQYGHDADAVQLVGLRKKVDRRSPARRTRAASPEA